MKILGFPVSNDAFYRETLEILCTRVVYLRIMFNYLRNLEASEGSLFLIKSGISTLGGTRYPLSFNFNCECNFYKLNKICDQDKIEQNNSYF